MVIEINEIKNPVLLFDGVCNLCNRSVQFVIKKDKKRIFRFASLQSELGMHVMQQYGLPVSDLNSFLLLENGKLYTKSTAALRLTRKLGGGWPLLYAFMIVPKFIRDGIYSWIARNRYKWFGKRDACWLPTPELKTLFLDN